MNALVNVDAAILLMNMFVQIVNWVFVNQNRFGNDLAIIWKIDYMPYNVLAINE